MVRLLVPKPLFQKPGSLLGFRRESTEHWRAWIRQPWASSLGGDSQSRSANIGFQVVKAFKEEFNYGVRREKKLRSRDSSPTSQGAWELGSRMAGLQLGEAQIIQLMRQKRC